LSQAIPGYRLCSRTVADRPALMSHRLGVIVTDLLSGLGLNLQV